MIEQYPDTIYIYVHSGETQGSDGSWVQGTRTEYTFKCRIEANSRGRRIFGSDGTMIDYRFICYAPLDGVVDIRMTDEDGNTIQTENGYDIIIDTVSVVFGEWLKDFGCDFEYTVVSHSSGTITGITKSMLIGQLNARIWL